MRLSSRTSRPGTESRTEKRMGNAPDEFGIRSRETVYATILALHKNQGLAEEGIDTRL